MEIDSGLVEKMKKENLEFKKLYEEHSELKHKVEELNKMKFLTVEQETEKKNHQKKKLIMKDKLEKIVLEYQSQSH